MQSVSDFRGVRIHSATFAAALSAVALSACTDAPATRDTADKGVAADTVVTVAFDAPRAISAMTVVGAAPILAIAPDGTRATAWVSAPNGGTDGRLHVMVSPREATANDSASVVRELKDVLGPIEPHGEAPPKLAWVSRAGGGHTLGALYVVGKIIPGRRFPASALRFVRSDDNGTTWSAPVTVTDDTTASLADGAHFGSHNFHALHGAPDGTFHVAWLDGRAGKSAVYTTHSTDGGKTWAPNVRVVSTASPMTEACPCCRTAIAADAKGTVYLAWRAVIDADTTGGKATPIASPTPVPASAGSNPHAQHGGPPTGAARTTIRDIVVSRSSDRGQTWSSPVRVHNDDWVFDGCPHAGPSMAVDDAQTLHVAWWTGKPGAAGVFYTQSRDNGLSFAAATPLGVAKASQPAHVQLAVVNQAGAPSRVLAAWDDGTLRVPQVVMRTSGNGGQSFSEATPISESGPAAAFPVLAVDAAHGSVMVAWSQQAADAAQAAAAARPNMKDPKAAMPLPSVGNTQVLLRTGVLQNGSAKQAASREAFAPIASGDMAPAYGVRVVHGARTGDSVQVATPGSVTLVNVWATWCTSCREEMADLDTLHRTYADRGLRVVAVSVDQGSQDKIVRYATGEKLGMSIAHDPENRIQSLYGVVGVPETYLIDATGRVTWKTSGNIHGGLPQARSAIEAALSAMNTNITAPSR